MVVSGRPSAAHAADAHRLAVFFENLSGQLRDQGEQRLLVSSLRRSPPLAEHLPIRGDNADGHLCTTDVHCQHRAV